MHQSVVSGGLKIVFAMVVLVLGWLLAVMVPSDSEVGGHVASLVLVRRNPLPPEGRSLDGAGHYIGKLVDSANDSMPRPLRDDYQTTDPASTSPTLIDQLPKRPESLKVGKVDVQMVEKETEAPIAEEIAEIAALPSSKTAETLVSDSVTSSSGSILGNVAPPIGGGSWASEKDVQQEAATDATWTDEIGESSAEFPSFPDRPFTSAQKIDEAVSVTPNSASVVPPTLQESHNAVVPMELENSGKNLGKLTIDESARFALLPDESMNWPVVMQPLPRTTVDPNSAGAHSPITLVSAEEILSRNEVAVAGNNRNTTMPNGVDLETKITQTVNRNKGDKPEPSLLQPITPVNSSIETSQTVGSLTLLPVSTFTTSMEMTPAEVAVYLGISGKQYRRFFDRNQFKLDSADHFPPGTILVIPEAP